MENYGQIRQLIDRVRARWRALMALRALVRGALIAALVIGAAVIASRWTNGAPVALMALAAAAAVLAAAALVWWLAPLRRLPGDNQVARYIEERAPSLGDRLVTAVDVADAPHPPALAPMMIADAARRSADVDLDAIVSTESLRRAGFQAAAAVLALGVVLFTSRGPARQAFDSASLMLFPDRVGLNVTPGNVRVKAGASVAIGARLMGNRAPVIAHVQVADGDRWRASEMTSDAAGSFRLILPAVGASFKYRVVAGAVTSPTYEVAVSIPPRVARIDLHYTYPPGLRLAPRTEDRRRRHLRARWHRRSRAGLYRPSGRHWSDDAGGRQAHPAGRGQTERAVRVAQSDQRRLLPAGARRSRRHRQHRRHGVLHPHARRSSA